MSRSVVLFACCVAWVACGDGRSAAPPPAAPSASEAATTVAGLEPSSETRGAVGKGTIIGRVVLTGESPALPRLDQGSDPVCPEEAEAPYIRTGADGGLRDVVVRVPDGAATGEPASEVVTLDQRECSYEPYVAGAVVGQKLRVLNSDDTLHNVNARHGESAIFNRPQPGGAPPLTRTLDEAGALTLRCDVHPWMLAHVLVGEHPYFAVTDEAGRFRIEGVPAGRYELEAWHPHLGKIQADAKVIADGEAKVDFAFASSSYEAPHR